MLISTQYEKWYEECEKDLKNDPKRLRNILSPSLAQNISPALLLKHFTAHTSQKKIIAMTRRGGRAAITDLFSSRSSLLQGKFAVPEGAMEKGVPVIVCHEVCYRIGFGAVELKICPNFALFWVENLSKISSFYFSKIFFFLQGECDFYKNKRKKTNNFLSWKSVQLCCAT